MLTPEGIALLWKLAAGSSDDTLDGWKIRVADTEAAATWRVSDDGVLTLSASFGADEANGEWSQREVVSGQGIVVDTENEDNGRKSPGSQWQVDVSIELAAQ